MNRKQRARTEKDRRHAGSLPEPTRLPRRRHEGPLVLSGLPTSDPEIMLIAPYLLDPRRSGLTLLNWGVLTQMMARWQEWANGLRPCPRAELVAHLTVGASAMSERRIERALDELSAQRWIVEAIGPDGAVYFLPDPERLALVITDADKQAARRT
jgi:hypothetical protein